MAHGHEIVVDDPKGEWDEGSIVDAGRAHQLKQRGVALLPVDTQLLNTCGIAGYMRRGWGAGYPIDSSHPKMNCPLTVYARASSSESPSGAVYWAARVVASDAAAERAKRLLGREHAPNDNGLVGQLQISPDPSQGLALVAGLAAAGTPKLMKDMGAPDADNGWLITGSAEARFPSNGVYGFGLFGWGPELRVAWAACTVVAKVDYR